MPIVRDAKKDVIAILCADLHLSLKPPVARSTEEDWLEKQACYLGELKTLGIHHDAPIVCAGDIFDKPNSSAELINFALDYLPQMYAIPGQHDLVHHSWEDRKKSAFWTLALAGKIGVICPDLIVEPTREDDSSYGTGLQLHGFPWGFPITPLDKRDTNDLMFDLAVKHAYIYTDKTPGYLGAPIEQHYRCYAKELKGYDAAVFGDNHKPFSVTTEHGCRIFNCGGFMRRKMDEIDHKPSVGLLHPDKTITRHYLDVSDDKFLDPKQMVKGISSENMDELMAELGKLTDTAINFFDALRQALDKDDVKTSVKTIIRSIMSEVEK